MTEHVLHLPNHLDEELATHAACGLTGPDITCVGAADRHETYYASGLCRHCADMYCLNCALTPGICYDTTCIYCKGSGVDQTPYGTGGDHCPWCGADWKVRCGH